jgi:hypothetical protein
MNNDRTRIHGFILLKFPYPHYTSWTGNGTLFQSQLHFSCYFTSICYSLMATMGLNHPKNKVSPIIYVFVKNRKLFPLPGSSTMLMCRWIYPAPSYTNCMTKTNYEAILWSIFLVQILQIAAKNARNSVSEPPLFQTVLWEHDPEPPSLLFS